MYLWLMLRIFEGPDCCQLLPVCLGLGSLVRLLLFVAQGFLIIMSFFDSQS